MKAWEEWPQGECYDETCPACGQPLIIAEKICTFEPNYYSEGSDMFTAICPDCRIQYLIHAPIGTLTARPREAEQAIRINALEARLTELEAIVQSLTERKPLSLPVTPKATPEEADFRKKYGYLF